MDINAAQDLDSLYPSGETYFYIPPFIAHRGLWDTKTPENSLAAIAAAAEAGMGIEIDVRLTADGEAVVFHDATLDRMCGTTGYIADMTAAELGDHYLSDSDQHIPTLLEALWVAGPNTPVFIELKVPLGEEGPLEARISDILDMVPNTASLLSFNPHSLAFMRDICPEYPRGLNLDAWCSPERGITGPNSARRRGYRNLAYLNEAEPHFLSVSGHILPDGRITAARRAGLPIIAWAAVNARELSRYSQYADSVMVEGIATKLLK